MPAYRESPSSPAPLPTRAPSSALAAEWLQAQISHHSKFQHCQGAHDHPSWLLQLCAGSSKALSSASHSVQLAWLILIYSRGNEGRS